MTTISSVNRRIVIISLNPIDFFCINDLLASERRHHNALLKAFLVSGLEQRRKLARKFESTLGPLPLSHAFEGLRKPCLPYGLNQVVERMSVESPDSEFIMRGHENHHGHVLSPNRPQHFKSIQSRHLDIKKNEVRFQLT